NVALGVDLPIIAAVGGLLVGDVNPLEIEGVSGFASHDVRGHGAGAGGVVELHVQFLSGLLIGRTAVHSGKDPAFVAYDQFLSTGILQPLSRGEVRCGSRAAVQATLALSPLCPPKRKSEASSVFCVLWSSAFAVAKLALTDCPPLLLLMARFLFAGSII